MAVLKKLLYGAVVLVVVVAMAGFMLPKEYTVERSIVIDAPPEEIYANVVDLRAWPQWGVWFKRDPEMKITYSGPDRAIGMRTTWQSQTEGDGEMEITELHHNRQVVYSLYFPEFDMGSTGKFLLEPVSEGTRVTWSDQGSVGMNPVDRYFVLMIDNLIGPDFETGLQNLKTVIENRG
ncbi:polyketide cyclase [Alteromonas aestuariivivens]|uniref:Polyketide cyclase n=1 Tax=Alteromonas aestuariivivens TaxID=1938339 RepID=A0A3D8MB81_9ALTE|nr:SRPBCC family protein [Alteromonas aestuariivivens]RDV27467.1 polyketide cyclase [Alteromonas aestuariivivens]